MRAFVQSLEGWIIAALAEFGVTAGVREGRIGVWVVKPDGSEAKIAPLVSGSESGSVFMESVLNVAPNLQHFEGIVPCGIRDFGVTSLADLGLMPTSRGRCRPDETCAGPFEPVSLKPLKNVKKAYVYMIRRQHLLVHEHVDYPDMPLALPGGTLEPG